MYLGSKGAFSVTSGVLESPCSPWDFSTSQVEALELCMTILGSSSSFGCRQECIHSSNLSFSFFFFFNDYSMFIFIYFIYDCVGSSFLSEGFLQLWQAGATPHHGAQASHHRGLSCSGAQAPDAQAQQLWPTGPAAPRHVGSSQTRARTRVPCVGRQIPNHCVTREPPQIFLEHLLYVRLCSRHWRYSRKRKEKKEHKCLPSWNLHDSGER